MTRHLLLVVAVASVIVYGLGDLASGLLYDGYSYKDQWISELGAFGSPVRPLMVAAILTHGVLLIAFGIGIWKFADRKSLQWVGLLLIVAGAIGLPTHTVFAMSSRGMTAGFNDTMHAGLSLAFGLVVFVAVALSAVIYPGRFRFYAIVTLATLVGFGAASSMAIEGIEQNFTPWAGAFERINAYSYFAWLIVLAVTVHRSLEDRQRPQQSALPQRSRHTSEPPAYARYAPEASGAQPESRCETSMAEAESRRIAGLLGPTMIVMIVSEFPLVQPRLYDAQIPPVVYLSGVLMFVAGLAIVRAHHHWRADWTVLVTLSGWFALALGAVRMFAASAYQEKAASVGGPVVIVVESVILVCGLVITYKAYVRRDAILAKPDAPSHTVEYSQKSR